MPISWVYPAPANGEGVIGQHDDRGLPPLRKKQTTAPAADQVGERVGDELRRHDADRFDDATWFAPPGAPGLTLEKPAKPQKIRLPAISKVGSKRLGRSSSVPASADRNEYTRTVPQRDLPADYTQEKDATVVVVPAIDFDESELAKVTGASRYEERQLFNLLLLADPTTRVVMVNSVCIPARVVGYYLNLKPGPDLKDRLERLWMLTPNDVAPRSLSQKILERKNLTKLVAKVAQGDATSKAGLSVFMGSPGTKALGEELGLRLLESAEDHDLYWGTKQGSRQLFAEAGIPHPRGTSAQTRPTAPGSVVRPPFVRSQEQLASQLALLIQRGANPKRWMVKLNEGFSGNGNAKLDLRHVQALCQQGVDGDRSKPYSTQAIADLILQALPTMRFEDPTVRWESTGGNVGYKDQIAKLGVVAEEFLEGEQPFSPSVQGVVDFDQDGAPVVRILSTHEQILDGQVYKGCVFPAREAYRERLMEYGRLIGNELALRGGRGHFAADFLATRNARGTWDLNGLEINLRQGGTTHPYTTMALLTDGKTRDDGQFETKRGALRCYIATDNLKDESMIGLKAEELIDALENRADPEARAVHWDAEKQRGVAFHLFGCLEEYGKLGFTAIGESPEDAAALYDLAASFVKKTAKAKREEKQRAGDVSTR